MNEIMNQISILSIVVLSCFITILILQVMILYKMSKLDDLKDEFELSKESYYKSILDRIIEKELKDENKV